MGALCSSRRSLRISIFHCRPSRATSRFWYVPDWWLRSARAASAAAASTRDRSTARPSGSIVTANTGKLSSICWRSRWRRSSGRIPQKRAQASRRGQRRPVDGSKLSSHDWRNEHDRSSSRNARRVGRGPQVPSRQGKGIHAAARSVEPSAPGSALGARHQAICIRRPRREADTWAAIHGRSQLIVYHFMFGPDWEAGCNSCSFWADNFNGIVPHLNQRDVTFVAISRAPLAKLQAFAKRLGWSFKWLSSSGGDFNYDYNVSFTPEELACGSAIYNYTANKMNMTELPGISVFFKDAEGSVFHP